MPVAPPSAESIATNGSRAALSYAATTLCLMPARRASSRWDNPERARAVFKTAAGGGRARRDDRGS